jgi:hypothetical protein
VAVECAAEVGVEVLGFGRGHDQFGVGDVAAVVDEP